MTNEQKIQEFVQQVYLTIYGRRVDDLTDVDGVEQIAKTLIWCNLFLDELELEKEPEGGPTNWSFLRENDAEIGTIATATDTFSLPDETLRPIADEERPLVIMQDGIIVSSWDVVDPSQITRRNGEVSRSQRVTYVNQLLVFSRALNDTEIGGTVLTDIVNKFPRLTSTDTTLFDLPLPRQLLVLGTAKNASLPDIVQGGLSPSYAQKYADLLEGAKLANAQSSVPDEAVTDDFSGIGGVW